MVSKSFISGPRGFHITLTHSLRHPNVLTSHKAGAACLSIWQGFSIFHPNKKNSIYSNDLKELKKTDGSRKSKITGIPKLDDANKAGTTHSGKCTLIVTEGDSAKTLAIAGLSVVGRDHYGVFPLRGKCKNVRDASVKQLTENKEFNDLKKILGLQQGKVYTSLSELRYGRLMIMTDADNDGSHIKGLGINLFDSGWPSLIDIPGFISFMNKFIVKYCAFHI